MTADLAGVSATARTDRGSGFRGTVQRLDDDLYDAFSRPLPTPFGPALARFTNIADHSKISMAMAGILAGVGGARGRRTAVVGLASVAATSAVANLVVKPLARRRRPVRMVEHLAHPEDTAHHVPMPASRSFPSGHSAAAAAFASATVQTWPQVSAVPVAVAGLVGYSRVHAGVHFPGDVLLGWALGVGIGTAVGAVSRRVSGPRGS